MFLFVACRFANRYTNSLSCLYCIVFFLLPLLLLSLLLLSSAAVASTSNITMTIILVMAMIVNQNENESHLHHVSLTINSLHDYFFEDRLGRTTRHNIFPSRRRPSLETGTQPSASLIKGVTRS